MKYVDFQNYIHVSSYKNIYFYDVRWIPEMNTCFHGIKILILKKYVDFQKCIPVSGYKNINFDEVVVFPEMYTWF